MLKKMKFCVLGAALLMSVTPMVMTGTTVYAAQETETSILTTEDVDSKIEVQSNEKWKAFEQEFAQMTNESSLYRSNISSYSANIGTKEELFQLIKKYDGAERTITVQQSPASGSYKYTEKFVTGGYNGFAEGKTSMERFRSDLATNATLLQINGTLGGALAGGPLGALIGLLGSSILSTRLYKGSDIMGQWINAESSKGGIRIVVQETFAIDNINSLQQSPIKKL